MDFRKALVAAMSRIDGWANIVTGVGQALGLRGRGSYEFQGNERQGDGSLEQLYHQDPFAAKVCEAMPKHALKHGFSVKTGDAIVESLIRETVRELNISLRAREAWTWARVFGGGAIVLGCDDGRKAWEPIDESALRRVLFLTSVTSRELWPQEWELDPLSPRFGEPTVYALQRVGGGGASEYTLVHHTRVVRFEGLPTTRARKVTLRGWGESYLQRSIDPLTEWNGAHAATWDLLQQASVGVLKMRGLFQMTASQVDESFKNRMEAMDIARSVARSVLIDADGESYERVEVGALSGLPDLLDRYSLRFSGAINLPVSVLLGREPAGLNATGESDLAIWDDDVLAERASTLAPALERIVKLVLLSSDGPTKGEEPKGWSLEFPPLRPMTDVQKADLRNKQANTDGVYLQNGVITPEEVARSRFRPEGWSMETEVDLVSRESEEKPSSPDAEDPQADAPDGKGDDGASGQAHSGMGGAGGPTKPAGILPPAPMNTEGQKS